VRDGQLQLKRTPTADKKVTKVGLKSIKNVMRCRDSRSA